MMDSTAIVLDESASSDEGTPLTNLAGAHDAASDTDADVRVLPGSHWARLKLRVRRLVAPPRQYHTRTVDLQRGVVDVRTNDKALSPNVLRNQKYNPYTFLFVVLFNEFKYFFNLYFLLVALSQFIPVLQIGYLFTYVAPLVFVLLVTISKEAYDDIQRWKRDREANGQLYERLTLSGSERVPSADLHVGDLVVVHKDERIPADLILLRTTEESGASFIRTDQLDGETDWKLRKAVTLTQKFPNDAALLSCNATFFAAKPIKDIYKFEGTVSLHNSKPAGSGNPVVEALSLENTLWMNTVLATGNAVGLVVYTGADTRSVMNTSSPKTKVGLLDLEMNRLAKVLFVLVLVLAFVMVAVGGFKGEWGIDFFRFILLFSSIIPISLRVSLDVAKTLYSYWIMRDTQIPGTVVRTSTIPEELGRISYLLSDKTGTLTQNEMVFKRLHLGTTSFNRETVDDLTSALKDAYAGSSKASGVFGSLASRSAVHLTFVVDKRSGHHRSLEQSVRATLEAIALCHNVTPSRDGEHVDYQASSPDEVALVHFSESVGLTLWDRDLQTITLRTPQGANHTYEVLDIFPFSSDTKRMGIVVRDERGAITFYLKGADVVMAKLIAPPSDWLDEECGNMAREGLRTLVFARRALSDAEYKAFAKAHAKAKSAMHDRDQRVRACIEEHLEHDLQLLALSGVEDKLQDRVKPTLEMLRNAGIRVWMLTGDKIETATNIAVSARLVGPTQPIFTIANLMDASHAQAQLTVFANKRDTALVIDGRSLQLCMDAHADLFARTATKAPAVVCCRCSPTQKADVVRLIKKHTKLQTAAIGDGGNDVSMIQAADVGLGIVGKEGKQASLAADFSLEQFHYVARLLIWHGRNSYKRSARLGQFVIHRGLIISFIQAVFSALFYFAAIAIYNGWLMVGYATWYTTAPVLSLLLDTDVSESVAFQYPELYRELQKGRALSFKTFFTWVLKSVYQGGMIMLLAIFLFDQSLYQVVSITFTTLILTELINVALEINRWHWLMAVAEVASLIIYAVSIAALPEYFDLHFILSWEFVWKVLVITLITTLPVYTAKFIKKRFFPPAYAKLS